LNEKDLELAEKISNSIEGFDRKIFPNNPTETMVFQERPPDEGSRFRYAPRVPNESGDDYFEAYIIFAVGLYERIENERRRKLILFREEEILRGLNEAPCYSLEEVLIGIAVHENKHKVDHYFPEKIFSPDHIQETNNPYFRRLLIYVDGVTRQTYSPEQLERVFEKEFSAAVIEHFVVEMWHWGARDIPEIAEIIGSGPNDEYFNIFFE